MKMGPAEITMLVGGILLLVIGIALLVYCVIKRRSYKGLLVIFPLAIIMIGFPSIKSFKVAGAEVDIKDSINGYLAHPNDPNAINGLGETLDKSLSPNAPTRLTAANRSNLSAAVAQLSRRTNLSAESRITLSKAQLVLGQTNVAAATLHSAIRVQTNLVADPKVRVLLKTLPR